MKKTKKNEENIKEQKYQQDYETVMQEIVGLLDPTDEDRIVTTGTKAKVVSSIITSKSRADKTESITQLILNSKGWLTVLSCDNNKDQLLQIKHHLLKQNINVYEVKMTDKLVDKVVNHLSNNENVVLIMLNNNIQVKRTTEFITKIRNIRRIEKYLCIHNEEDMVNNTDQLHDIWNNELPEKRKEWIRHFETTNFGFKKVRRIWVVTTPKNF